MMLKPKFKEIRCVIFDIDGVILDSSGLKTGAFKKLYSQYEEIQDAVMQYHFANKGMSRYLQFEYVTNSLMNVTDPASTAQEMAEKT